MTAADDDLIEYQRSNSIPWLDKKLTLEIHVERLTGDTEKLMDFTFEEGEDHCTMGNVLSRAKDRYPAPKNQRPVLTICDRVLNDASTQLQTPIRTYLHRYCRDYNSNSTKLQLRATLIFVKNITWLDHRFTLEIHVERLNGDTEKTMSYIFEEGEDDYTMENVLSQAKDLYPTPEKTRPMLSLCDRVLHDQSDELQRTIRTYLLH